MLSEGITHLWTCFSSLMFGCFFLWGINLNSKVYWQIYLNRCSCSCAMGGWPWLPGSSCAREDSFDLFYLNLKKTSRSLLNHQHLGHLIIYIWWYLFLLLDRSSQFCFEQNLFCWGCTETLFLPGKEGSLREIVNSMESLRQFCLSKAQLCLRSMWLPHCPLVTYSWLCFHSHSLCAGAASGSAFPWSRLQCACCVCCRNVALLGACTNAITGASSSCRDMVQCCFGCLFASRRACSTCSDILPLVQTFILRPPEFIML